MLERFSNLVRSGAPRPHGLRVMFAAALLTVATLATAVDLRADHPDTYVVKRGDTLWDISARFLQKPWLWPEIWQANPQIKNPHLIYPGDIISLAYLDRVAVQQGPRTESPVNAVPLAEIEPFLKDLRVMDDINGLPYVVGLEDDRMHASQGQVAYVKGLEGAQPGQRYLVVRADRSYHRGAAVFDCCDRFKATDLDARGHNLPDVESFWTNPAYFSKDGAALGVELRTQSSGTVTRVSASAVTTLLLDSEGRDVRVGDRLIPVVAQPYDLQFFPHPPKQQAEYSRLQVMAVADGYKFGGTRDVIAISGGSAQGIDNGTVFSIWRHGSHVNDRVKHSLNNLDGGFSLSGHKVRLPDEFAGHAMVFRTFNNVSYALIMSSVKPTHEGYELKHPDATE